MTSANNFVLLLAALSAFSLNIVAIPVKQSVVRSFLTPGSITDEGRQHPKTLSLELAAEGDTSRPRYGGSEFEQHDSSNNLEGHGQQLYHPSAFQPYCLRPQLLQFQTYPIQQDHHTAQVENQWNNPAPPSMHHDQQHETPYGYKYGFSPYANVHLPNPITYTDLYGTTIHFPQQSAASHSSHGADVYNLNEMASSLFEQQQEGYTASQSNANGSGIVDASYPSGSASEVHTQMRREGGSLFTVPDEEKLLNRYEEKLLNRYEEEEWNYDHVFLPQIQPYYQQMKQQLQQGQPADQHSIAAGPSSQPQRVELQPARYQRPKEGEWPGSLKTRKQISSYERGILGNLRWLPDKLQLSFDVRSNFGIKGKRKIREREARGETGKVPYKGSKRQFSHFKRKMSKEGKLSVEEEAAYRLNQAVYGPQDLNELFWIPEIPDLVRHDETSNPVTKEARKGTEHMEDVDDRRSHLLATYAAMGKEPVEEPHLTRQVDYLKEYWARLRRTEARKAAASSSGRIAPIRDSTDQREGGESSHEQ